MLKRMSCHRMASSSLCWPLMMSMPPMFTRGSASTRRVMLTTCGHTHICIRNAFKEPRAQRRQVKRRLSVCGQGEDSG